MVYSICDAMLGLGYTIGPMIGSFLYEYGGFVLPFLVCGGAILVTGVISLVTCHNLIKEAESEKSPSSKSSSMLPILSNFDAALSLLSVVAATFTVGFMESCLELHLEIFALSVTSVGLCFLGLAISYTSATLSSGFCIDRCELVSQFL